MSRCFSIFVAIAACLVSLSAIADDILNIGAAAPPLAVSSFVKGEKIDGFDPAKTYVVEFWATWCGPCRASIPHLTEVAHQYKDKGVQFVGVDVWEDDTSKVQPFIDEMGEKMDYAVALDTIDAANPREGTMAKTWLRAADENGIPTAFVVHDGKIAWIGHPMNLEPALAKITSGQWDLAEMAKQRLADKEKQRKLMAAQTKILTFYGAKDYPATLAAIDEVVKDNPDLADDFAGYKFASLCNTGEIEKALAVGNQILEDNKDNPGGLNSKFWDAIDPKSVDHVDPQIAALALKAAQRAVELSKGADPNCLDSLAEAQFRTGDAAAAVATEEKTIAWIKANIKNVTDDQLKEFNDHLDRYRKAVDKDVKKDADNK